MAEFLTTTGISHHLENIIREANKKLFIVSPYLKLSRTFLERLHDASDKGVIIKIIFGKDKLNPNEMELLTSVKNIDLFFSQNLHAKCYFNETKMLITSMNLYEFSEKNNREMGILITRQSDTQIFEKALEEVKSIIQSSKQITTLDRDQIFSGAIKNNSKQNKDIANHKLQKGFCIRCEKEIPLDPSRPYCVDCYSVWSEYENSSYEENVCHYCGQAYDTSMDEPLCDDCFDENDWD